jgi:hypothetical protein
MDKNELDLFSRVAMLMIHDPRWIQIMAGLGMGRALEKVGKFSSPPHRSNEELSAEGVPVGNPGQTGMPDAGQMAQKLRPPGLGPNVPGMPGF